MKWVSLSPSLTAFFVDDWRLCFSVVVSRCRCSCFAPHCCCCDGGGRLSIRSSLSLPALFLLNSSLRSFSVAEDSAKIDRPWVIDCAKTGLVEPVVPFPAEGTPMHHLLYCVVDSTLWDEDPDRRLQSDFVNWCFDPYLLTRSCRADDVDPYEYLFKCLFANDIPGIGGFPIQFETPEAVANTTIDPFAEDIIYVEPLIGAACALLDGIRSSECLFTYFQSLSAAPSAVPSLAPTSSPSHFPSYLPSNAPTAFPSSDPSAVPSDEPSLFPTTFTTESVSPMIPPRYPPIVVQIQILLRFVLENIDIALPPSDGIVRVFTTGLGNILTSNVEGHQLVEIVHVDYARSMSDLSIILRATGRRECVDCVASELTREIENGYEEALKLASRTGSLVQQIEFHGFVSDVPNLIGVTVDPESVESIASVNRNKVLDKAEHVSSAINIGIAFSLWIVGLANFLPL